MDTLATTLPFTLRCRSQICLVVVLHKETLTQAVVADKEQTFLLLVF